MANPVKNAPLFNAVYEKYVIFDQLSHDVVAKVIGRQFSSMDNASKIVAATAVKVVAVVALALAVINIITSPFLTLGTFCIGAVFSPKQQRTQDSIESWFKSAYVSVIDSVFENENIVERVAMSVAVVFTATVVATTIFAPVGLGLFLGYHFGKEAFKIPPEPDASGSSSLIRQA